MRKFLGVTGVILSLFVMSLTTPGAKADSATISQSGVWGSAAPTTNWSAPGDTWTFSFTVPNPDSVTALNGTMEMMTTAFSDFSYTLNGVAVNIAPADVIFFPSSEDGGFDIDFTAGGTDTTNGIVCSPSTPCSFNTFGDQFFSGNAPNITIQSGSLSAVDFDYTASGDDTNPNGTGTVTTAPEPATLSLLALGALALFVIPRRK
jgi:hypothetical protein